MTQPEGFNDGTDRVCKLQKSLYGLKQSPRCWNQRFREVLIEFNPSESLADPCLFHRNINGNKLLVALYVDDGLVAASRETDIQEFLEKLKSEFKITIEKFGLFLNMQITQEPDGSITIN